MDLVASYATSMFKDFESYIRTEVDSVEDDIGLVLDPYKTNFITYKLPPGI